MNKLFVNSFNKDILNKIRDFERVFYIIQRHKSTKCECSFKSGNGDPNCPLCLGTGNQITIRKIKAAKQDSGLPEAMRPSSEIFMGTNYYIDGKYKNINNDDLIVDLLEKEVEYFYQTKEERSFNSIILYTQTMAVRYKIEKGIFFSNFNDIIGGEK